jgi:glycosyltransferase involved in cell wall biosynthesis
MTHRWDRWLNRRLLTRQLSEFADGATVITTIPIVADLVDTLPATRWLYYCVDDFAVWPGLDGKILGRLEDELLGKVDCIVAASDHLAEGIRRRGREAEVLTHGVDLEFWKREGVASGEEREKLRGASCELREERRIADCENSKLETRNSSPLILFWGVVDRRMNAEWVLALGDSLERGVIKLVGPQQDPDPRLAVHSRIEMPGPVEFEQLPRLAAQADVLIMPYADLPVTRAMQPLKLKEYLATEKPVVASRLPAVEQWSDCLQMVDSQQGFVDRVVQLVSNFDGSSQSDIGLQQAVDVQRIERLRQRLELESWAAKASQFERLAGLAATSSV